MTRKSQEHGHSSDASDKKQLSLDIMNYIEKASALAESIWGLSCFTNHLVRTRIPACAASGYHVLITGETGTGKELVANEIARYAGKQDRLVSVNCAAIPKALAESELFGHKKGAFTGATSDKKGFFEKANDGILFLDEIGELPSFMQAKLLRAAQFGEVQGVGEDEPKKVKVRLIAATNRPEKLRADIRWRFPEQIEMPPLRERFSDLFALLCLALKKARDSGKVGESAYWVFSPATIIRILYSSWPGNFRELENAANLSVARYSCLDKKTDEVPFEFNMPSEEVPQFRDFPLIQELWTDFEKSVRHHPDHRKYVGEKQWQLMRFLMTDGLFRTSPFHPPGKSGIATTSRPASYVGFGKPTIRHVDGTITRPGPGEEARCEYMGPYTEDCLSFGQFAVCYALTLRYWNERGVYRPVMDKTPFVPDQTTLFIQVLDSIVSQVYRLPIREEPAGAPGLTGYTESELLRAYYTQLDTKHPTTVAISRSAGISEDAAARRRSKYCPPRKRGS